MACTTVGYAIELGMVNGNEHQKDLHVQLLSPIAPHASLAALNSWPKELSIDLVHVFLMPVHE
eukprot:1236455-Rhodomonas_salina.1